MILTARKTLATILLRAMVLFLGACSVAESKKGAEQTADTLYHTLATGDMEAVMDLYSDRFYQETSREEWQTVLRSDHDRLGDYQTDELVNWNVWTGVSTEVTGTATTLVYHVQYSKYDATEQLTFFGSSRPQLVGHHFNSKGLLLD
ncbi:MAG: hypothetical protein ACE5K9_03005 [Candidatus Methylomirabilales bacterium]